MATSVGNKDLRYVWGGATEKYPNRLGWWERRALPRDTSDTTLVITPEYDRRPDLLAFDLYGKDIYATLILQYNNILDINTEFVSGREIIVPSYRRVTTEIVNQNTGGVEPESMG